MRKIKNIKKEKKAQIFGMSFEMIFSIFLAAVFLFAAIFAIKHFIGIKDCKELVDYTSGLQNKIDQITFNTEYTETAYFSAPTSLKVICFANVSISKNIGSQSNKETIEAIWTKASRYHNFNIILWPEKVANGCGLKPYQQINNLALNELNPICFFNSQGKIRINLEKGYNDALARVVR